MNSTLYIVIPCYKEQEVLHETASRLKVKMESLIAAGKISSESRVMFVNDGSSDTPGRLSASCTSRIRCSLALICRATAVTRTHF